jgi:GMP synthase (glutamine-hydrolysing)
MTKPFLILQLRPEDEASDDEFRAFLRYGHLTEDAVHRVRMETDGVPSITLSDYSGIIVGGGPYNVSDTKKDTAQQRLEEELMRLLDDVVEQDFPYLGMCYGLGALCAHRGVRVSKEQYGEDVGALHIQLSDEGMKDPLLIGLPKTFTAFGGHKEACQSVPVDAVLLASSDTCPVQMIRVGHNVYATQFHTELDEEGIGVRFEIYKHHGYYDPEDIPTLKAEALTHTVTEPMKILERFVERYKQPTE